MNSRDFKYWLQGYFELGGQGLDTVQKKMVREHLALVEEEYDPFISWLTGFLDATAGTVITPDMACDIKARLQMEFEKQTHDLEALRKAIEEEIGAKVDEVVKGPPIRPWEPTPLEPGADPEYDKFKGPYKVWCSDQTVEQQIRKAREEGIVRKYGPDHIQFPSKPIDQIRGSC